MNKSQVGMIVTIVVLTVLVIVGVIYGVATHTEPGLMQSTPGFTRSDLPINVCPGGYVPDAAGTEQAYQATQAAVDITNQRLGLTMLRVVGPHDDLGPCRITVRVGVPSDHGGTSGIVVDPGGAATFSNGSRECEVTTTNISTSEMLDLVLQHELGHCLGLAHDCWAGSIMCGGSCCTLEPSPDGSYPPRIDDSDRALLRHVFGQQ